MSRQYSQEQIDQCVRILQESTSYRSASERIGREVSRELATSTNLAGVFRRAGMRPPSHYVGGLNAQMPPPQHEAGVLEFPEIDVEWDEETNPVASPRPVAQPGQHQRSGQLRTILAVPDIHAPFHDDLAVDTCVEAVRVLRPDHLVFLGDVPDSYDISDFPRDPARKHRYKEEIASANEVLDRFDRCRVPDVRYCAGNHCDRLARYIAKRAPELHGLLDISTLLRIQERGWQWIPYGEVTTIGRFHFSHEFGTCGKYAAAQALAGTRHCIVFGHTHRAQCEYGGLADGERHVAWSSGWLGDYEALAFSYKKKWQARREWTHGFTRITLDETGCGWANFVPILDGRCVVDGLVISGRKEAA